MNIFAVQEMYLASFKSIFSFIRFLHLSQWAPFLICLFIFLNMCLLLKKQDPLRYWLWLFFCVDCIVYPCVSTKCIPQQKSLQFLFSFFSGQVTRFTVLCEQYQPSLKRDPSYREYLDRIGQLFFNLPAPRPQQGPGGIFGKCSWSFVRIDFCHDYVKLR